jgi:hypothetical protein
MKARHDTPSLTEVQACLQIAFGNQTISPETSGFCPIFRAETHGFASLPRDRFALIVYEPSCKELAPPLPLRPKSTGDIEY